MPSISIAMATYNGAKYLLNQLESIARQTRLPEELVVTDDCSTDESVQILWSFSRRAPFKMKIIVNKDRLGYRDNFSKCAQLCVGDVIAFCDQDDIWRENKIEVCLDLLGDPQYLLVQHGFEAIGSAGERITPELKDVHEGRINPWLNVLGFTQVFRRELLAYEIFRASSVDHNSPEHAMAHDQWIYFLASSMNAVRGVDIPLVQYRQHGENVSGLNAVKRTRKGSISSNAITIAKYLCGRGSELQEKRDILRRFAIGRLKGAESRISILTTLSKETSPSKSELLTAMIEYYNSYGDFAKYRLLSFDSLTLFDRMFFLLRSVFSGGYRTYSDRPLRDPILDAFYGILKP